MTDLRRSLLRGMSGIVSDLYGQPTPKKTAVCKAADEPVPANPPALPPFEALWRTADDSIDWTDILVSPTPTDGLTPPAEWAFLHGQADAVLHGDQAAYLAVLSRVNPMADLLPYVAALEVTTVDSDTLRASFTPRPDLMDGDAQSYLCGMAVRIARDLFAALPVLTVEVTIPGYALVVAFSRAQMNKVRFAFIDPVEFAKKCGATFLEE